MKELVIISGKGGTGKTSLIASFAALAVGPVMVDCDVDAADLHLVLEPRIEHRRVFVGGRVAVVHENDCAGCGTCRDLCRFDAVVPGVGTAGGEAFFVEPISCEGCGVCSWFCPTRAIDMVERESGVWFISETRHGPMVHARLGIAEANSGRLVSLIRTEARRIAEESGRELVLVDGPPGIGCPVIASLSGASTVLVVTEPTLAALHDLERVVALTAHFDIPTMACINKHDLCPEVALEVGTRCRELGVEVVGRVPYDTAITRAQLERRSVVEMEDGPGAAAIRETWRTLERLTGGPTKRPNPSS